MIRQALLAGWASSAIDCAHSLADTNLIEDRVQDALVELLHLQHAACID